MESKELAKALKSLSGLMVAWSNPKKRGWEDLDRYPVGSTVHLLENHAGKYEYITKGVVCAQVTRDQTGYTQCLVCRVDTHVDPVMVMVEEQFDFVGMSREEVYGQIQGVIDGSKERNRVWKDKLKDFKL